MIPCSMLSMYLALIVVVVEAGYASLPITRTTFGLYFTATDVLPHAQGHSAQFPIDSQFPINSQSPYLLERALQDRDAFVASSKHRAPWHDLIQKRLQTNDDVLFALYWSLYTTPVSIGNPSLKLTATVDTSWSTFFVPSANCTNDPKEFRYCRDHPLYNSSLSSTYRSILTPASVQYTGLYTWGNVSQDSLHVAGMEVKNQGFEEATIWHADPTSKDEFFDTALGFSLFPTRDADKPEDFSSQSPFRSMIEQQLLDRNVVALIFPRSDLEIGYMVLGSLPPYLRQEDLIEIPLDNRKTNKSDRVWRFYTMNGWQILVKSMTIASSDFEASTPVMETAQIAIVSSSFPWIGIPDEVAERIHKAIGMKDAFDWIVCARRPEMPDWTVMFGPDDQTITLAPWDYLIEMDSRYWGRLICISAFMGLGEHEDMGFILLGAPFLNGLYTVFDADRNSISYTNRPL